MVIIPWNVNTHSHSLTHSHIFKQILNSEHAIYVTVTISTMHLNSAPPPHPP
jgi:hypothetical protein